ncbi:MAG: hypothetical protein HOK37_10570 [Gammaproteobacteria bacterium]|jgi:hypothetical protein|nr:hypothetical protein [Gammaproteobacteria bacterium]
MIKAIEGLNPQWYQPKGQQGENPTTFRIRPLDGAEFGEIADFLTMENNQVFITNKGRSRCLDLALLDWANFNDSKGAVVFNMDNMRLIPHPIRSELASRIINISTLTGEEEGN